MLLLSGTPDGGGAALTLKARGWGRRERAGQDGSHERRNGVGWPVKAELSRQRVAGAASASCVWVRVRKATWCSAEAEAGRPATAAALEPTRGAVAHSEGWR